MSLGVVNSWFRRQANNLGLLTPTPAAAITNLTLTGTYATDVAGLQAAINGILAALRTNNIVSP